MAKTFQQKAIILSGKGFGKKKPSFLANFSRVPSLPTNKGMMRKEVEQKPVPILRPIANVARPLFQPVIQALPKKNRKVAVPSLVRFL